MFPLLKNEKACSKTYLSTGPLPDYVDASQPPQKRRPWSSIWEQKWSHHVDLILPAELLQVLEVELAKDAQGKIRYAKVIMSLHDMLSGDFFNAYIKTGTVAMLSEGRRGTDPIFSLHDGLLRLELDRPTYERAGLVGLPTPDGGRKHARERYAVEVNLRLPSMLHGKKGFERVVWAAKNVLNQSVTWLFFDFGEARVPQGLVPLDKYHPQWIVAEAHQQQLSTVRIPQMGSSSDILRDHEYAADLEEWFSLLALDSPRVMNGDNIDHYLCRYAMPEVHESDGIESERSQPTDLIRLRWRGFIPAASVVKLLIAATRAAREGQGWLTMMAHGFADDHLTILTFPGSKSFVAWQHQARL